MISPTPLVPIDGIEWEIKMGTEHVWAIHPLTAALRWDKEAQLWVDALIVNGGH